MGHRREGDRKTRRIRVHRLPSGDLGVLRAPGPGGGSRPASQSPTRAAGAGAHHARPATAAPAPTAVPATVDTDECALIAAAGEAIATVGLTDRIDPRHAPRPTNESERLLFRQLYETLVTVDCLGRVRPALAASWRLDADGRTWILALRENARFADGTPVTADDVRASWSADGNRDQLHPVESIVAVDNHAVAITFKRQHADVDAVRVLAHPDLAIAKPVADSAWPLGTRSARLAPPVIRNESSARR